MAFLTNLTNLINEYNNWKEKNPDKELIDFLIYKGINPRLLLPSISKSDKDLINNYKNTHDIFNEPNWKSKLIDVVKGKSLQNFGIIVGSQTTTYIDDELSDNSNFKTIKIDDALYYAAKNYQINGFEYFNFNTSKNSINNCTGNAISIINAIKQIKNTINFDYLLLFDNETNIPLIQMNTNYVGVDNEVYSESVYSSLEIPNGNVLDWVSSNAGRINNGLKVGRMVCTPRTYDYRYYIGTKEAIGFYTETPITSFNKFFNNLFGFTKTAKNACENMLKDFTSKTVISIDERPSNCRQHILQFNTHGDVGPIFEGSVHLSDIENMIDHSVNGFDLGKFVIFTNACNSAREICNSNRFGGLLGPIATGFMLNKENYWSNYLKAALNVFRLNNTMGDAYKAAINNMISGSVDVMDVYSYLEIRLIGDPAFKGYKIIDDDAK